MSLDEFEFEQNLLDREQEPEPEELPDDEDLEFPELESIATGDGDEY